MKIDIYGIAAVALCLIFATGLFSAGENPTGFLLLLWAGIVFFSHFGVDSLKQKKPKVISQDIPNIPLDIKAELARIQITISGGLCYHTAEAKHAQLRDADRMIIKLLEKL
jgi:hypothetical protein